MLCWAALRSVAYHQQMRRNLLAHLGQDPNAVERPLYRPEIGNVDQQFFSWRRVGDGSGPVRRRTVDIAVDEVRNHPDFLLDSEHLDGVAPQVLADRGDAV